MEEYYNFGGQPWFKASPGLYSKFQVSWEYIIRSYLKKTKEISKYKNKKNVTYFIQILLASM